MFTTPIVIGEVSAKFQERIQEAAHKFVKLAAEHPVLKIVHDPAVQALLNPIDISRVERDFAAEYRMFREDIGMQVIPIETASAVDVFDSYFSGSAPFGEGKKKHEFPDAFNVSALETWCRERGERMYVVSSDGDLKEHCSKSRYLVWLSTPAAYIDAYSQESERLRRIEESVREHLDDLQEAISTAFQESGFYLDDQDGEVYDVEVKEVEIDDLSLLQADEAIAKFEVTGQIAFKATVSYLDQSTGFWDSEDKIMRFMETAENKVDRSVKFVLTANISVSDDGHFEIVDSVDFGTKDFAVTAVEDEWPYK